MSTSIKAQGNNVDMNKIFEWALSKESGDLAKLSSFVESHPKIKLTSKKIQRSPLLSSQQQQLTRRTSEGELPPFTGCDIVDTYLLPTILQPHNFESEKSVKLVIDITRTLFNNKVSKPNEVETVFVQGDEAQVIKKSSFEMALEQLCERNTPETSEELLQLKLELLQVFLDNNVDMSIAQTVCVREKESDSETLAYMQNWHLTIRKGFFTGLEYYIRTCPGGPQLEAISIASMKLLGATHAELCTKALHLAAHLSDDLVSFSMVKLLLENGAQVNSFSLRNEEPDEGDDDESSEVSIASDKTNKSQTTKLSRFTENSAQEEESDNESQLTKQIKYRCVETALHIAIKRQHIPMVRLLMQHGADKAIPFVQCPVDTFPIQSVKEVLDREFILPTYASKNKTGKAGDYEYERVCREFIDNPFDARALITVEKLVDFYCETEEAKTDMFNILDNKVPPRLEEYLRSFGL